MRWRSYILHVVLGVTGATILCWFVALVLGMTSVPRGDAYVLAPTFVVPLLVGLLVGAFAALGSQDRLSRWVWIPLSVWLLLGLLAAMGVAGRTLRKALAIYFGTHCGESDCTEQFLITLPFAVSVGYSLGAHLYFLVSQRQ